MTNDVQTRLTPSHAVDTLFRQAHQYILNLNLNYDKNIYMRSR
jgi:hypothetical protein